MLAKNLILVFGAKSFLAFLSSLGPDFGANNFLEYGQSSSRNISKSTLWSQMLEQRVSSSMFHHPPETSQNLPLVSGVGAKSFLECGPSFSRSFSKSTSGCRFWIKKFPWEWSIILQKISQNLPLVYDDGAKSFISQNLSLVYDFGAKSFICQNLPLVSDVGAKSFIYQNLPFVSDVGAKSFIYQNLPFVSDIGAKSVISQNPPLVSEM